MTLKDIVKKLNVISLESAQDIILTDHWLKHLASNSELKSLSVNLEKKSLLLVNKISKALSVSPDAVISIAAQNYMKIQKEDELIKKTKKVWNAIK